MDTYKEKTKDLGVSLKYVDILLLLRRKVR